MTRSNLFLGLAVLAASAVPAAAQIPFTLRVQQGILVANGQTLNFTGAAIGLPDVVTLTGTYTGPTTAVISSQPQVVGSTDFTVSPLTLPLTLTPNASFKVDITYTPSSVSPAAAQLLINFAQTAATTSGQPLVGTIGFNLSGLVPNFSVNYIQAPNNNVTPVLNGGTIAFPPTLVNTTSTTTIVIANTGSGGSNVNSIAVTGAAFQVQGLGLLPTGVASGGTITFTIKYSPTTPGTDTGTLTIVFPNQTFTVNLTGTATSSIISYTVIDGQNLTPVASGGQIVVPDTPVGVTRTVAIQVSNNGTAPTTVNSLTFSGAGFTVTNVPILPITLNAGESFTFNLNFTPTGPGPINGTLTVGPDRFQLVGNGLGGQLTFSYVNSPTDSPVGLNPQGTILFPSVALGQTSSASFTIRNNGTSNTTLTSIGIVGPAAASFSIPNLPTLPTVLAPGSTYTFMVLFKPVATGLNSANVLINGQSFSLSAFGTTIPALTQFLITGLSGQVQPLTQPAFGLTIPQPYALDLTGTLTMTLSTNEFYTDPSVQFATGGRAVAFTIPAGSTQAVFANGATQLQIQTGTVAETIQMTAAFTTTNGVTISPPSSAPIILTVPALAPTLLGVTLQNFAVTGFNVVLDGYSTTRNLGKVNLVFTAAKGYAFPTTSFTIDVSGLAASYFRNAGSQAFGGLFEISIPIAAPLPTGTTLTSLSGLVNVSATITNDVGTSNSAP